MIYDLSLDRRLKRMHIASWGMVAINSVMLAFPVDTIPAMIVFFNMLVWVAAASDSRARRKQLRLQERDNGGN